MLQKVIAPDQFGNQVFRWDTQNRIISTVHDGNLLYYRLGDDWEFHFLKSEPKKKPKQKLSEYPTATE
jgi:hypothetical protein